MVYIEKIKDSKKFWREMQLVFRRENTNNEVSSAWKFIK